MNNNGFINIINESFSPILLSLGFKNRKDSISGKLYESLFTGNGFGVSISFEPGERLFNVIIFSDTNGALSDIDNTEKSPRLSDLNRKYMSLVSHEEISKNERIFSKIKTHDKDEEILLKMAKELRLTLPIYMDTFPRMHS